MGMDPRLKVITGAFLRGRNIRRALDLAIELEALPEDDLYVLWHDFVHLALKDAGTDGTGEEDDDTWKDIASFWQVMGYPVPERVRAHIAKQSGEVP